MDEDLDTLLLQTLQELEWRLRRLEFVLHGNVTKTDTDRQATVTTRLENLERSLQKLSSESQVVSEAMQLYSRHPDLFKPSLSTGTPDELDLAGRMAIVLMEAPSYPTTASQLSSLNDLPLPPTEAFTSLVALQPRMMELVERQYKQAVEVAELRKKSVVLILRWHEVLILGQGRCWAEWDTRLRNAERTIRREEVRRGREEGLEIAVVDGQ